MDIKSYIESGILEKYLLEKLNSKETKAVQKIAAQHPEIQAELGRIEKALENYAQLHAVEPPLGLKAKILTAINQSSTTKSSNNHSRFLSIAIGALLIIKGLTIFYFYQKNQTLADNATQLYAQFEQMKTDVRTLTQQNQQVQYRVESLEEKVNILRNEHNESVILKSTQNASEAIAQVHWNTHDEVAYLDIIKMKPAPLQQQYQLWGKKNDQYTNLGAFEVKSNNEDFLKIEFIQGVESFSITLEDVADNTTSPDKNALQAKSEI